MKSKIADWFEVSVQYVSSGEEFEKTVKEKYCVQGINFTDAEAKITELLGTQHGLYVKAIARAQYREIFFKDDPIEGDWFKAQVKYSTEVMEDSSSNPELKEMTSSVHYLIQASDMQEAVSLVKKIAESSMTNHAIGKITQTKIVDVLTA